MAIGAIALNTSTLRGETPISFDTEILPILTKAGCNSGACHGAAAGRGEFHLSLFGSEPERDYRAIVLELEGRRINPVDPAESLLLLKATESISHGGGTRLEYDGPDVRTITQWIAQGANRGQSNRLTKLAVSPATPIMAQVGQTIELKAEAAFDQRPTRDVTLWTVFTADDSAAVAIDSATGRVEVKRSGRHVVIARYLDRVVPVVFLAPLGDEPVDLSQEPRFNFIDEHILATLEALRMHPAPAADDLTFIRRATLDLTGRLPTPAQARKFQHDPSPLKRAELIDRLLVSNAFNEYWTHRLAKLLRIQIRGEETQAARAYHAWLYEQVAQNAGYDSIVRQLLLAEGDTSIVGPANFYRTAAGPREQAEFASEFLLGSRLRCANCHNHPLDRWTQDDYHGLAAIFATVPNERIIAAGGSGEVVHPRTGEPAVARIPGDRFLAADADRRQALTEWLVAADNRYFAKAIVNRLWKALMGRGLVEPTDDLRDTNPATHPQLLDELAADFVAHGYDLRHTLRTIATSAAYGRSAASNGPPSGADVLFYARGAVRPLEAEVLADALSDVTGVRAKYGDQREGTRAVGLFAGNVSAPELDILGRCLSGESCGSSNQDGAGLAQTLHLMNGELINRRISDPQGRLASLIDQEQSPAAVVRECYWLALCRPPTSEEMQFWQEQMDKTTSPDQQTQLLEDFLWGLLTSREFTTNH